ncbi:RnfH family protein [Cognatilysobacter segetis]|uniref:RnfH family protein n=1 Tax=Cognatilysobacter segetis TaxID=2492394 RepID=UPI00192E3EEB|nr:RnfH family protein [Lysobacter segetis]
MIRVEIIRAWPRRHESRWIELPDGATVDQALAACGEEADAVAVFGERAAGERVLVDGDRVEILRPLIADPKDARRRRAARAP